jgi:radical SAM superfamily enzyme YgiQ (UPF0313 family)
VEHVREAVALAKDIGFQINLFFLIGMPGDTFKTFRESLNFAKALGAHEVRFYNAVPYPGTELYQWVAEHGRFLYPPEDYLNSLSYWDEEPVFETDDFRRDERVKAFKEAETFMMETLCKNSFGNMAGRLAFQIWSIAFLRKYTIKSGQFFWQKFRILRNRFA